MKTKTKKGSSSKLAVNKKSVITSLIFCFIFVIGLSLLLYPSVSNYYNSFHQSKAINTYIDAISAIDEEAFEKMRKAAESYNRAILSRDNTFLQNEAEAADYQRLLDPTGTGIMGYIQIPKISVSLPIYHGTSDAVLEIGAGHLEWTSLPVGGDGSHCVLSGHRGLPSATLFSHLDRITEGDIFMLNVLGETYTYETDRILIVEPEVVTDLAVVPGKDYCTLVTCTPYGINTHRLLVRGHRIENAIDLSKVVITEDAVQLSQTIVSFAIGIPVLLIVYALVFRFGLKDAARIKKEDEEESHAYDTVKKTSSRKHGGKK